MNSNNQQRWKMAAFLLCSLLLLLQLGFVYNAPWIGDYWEHRAVLKELILHPFQPLHPILNVDAPHAFYSPYSVGLGLIGYSLKITAEQMLNAAALLNLILFFYAVHILCKLFLPNQPQWKSFTLLLLMLLFCWGFDPSNFSSFYHFGTFAYVMPYPATFSFICCVIAAGSFSWLLKNPGINFKSILLSVFIIALLWVALLTHPLTYLFAGALFIYVLAQKHQNFHFNRLLFTDVLLSLLFMLLPFALALMWSYYPFYQLLTYVQPGNQVHADSRELYSSLYFKLFPLVFLLFLFYGNLFQKIKNHQAILLAVLFLSVLFFYGFISGSYGFGRTIAFITMLAQILLLKMILELTSKNQQRAHVVLLVVAALPFSIPALQRNTKAATISHGQYLQRTPHQPFDYTEPAELAHRLLFLKAYFKPGDAVLADTVCIKYLPGLGARVTASIFPAYWINDNASRLNEIKTFFYTGDAATQLAILKTYQPNYILLTPTTQNLLPQLSGVVEKLPLVSQNGIGLYKVTRQVE